MVHEQSDVHAHEAKRVLVITKNDFLEQRDGGAMRAGAVVDELRSQGFEVDCVCVRPGFSNASIRGLLTPMVVWNVVRTLVAFLSTLSASVFKWFSPRAAVTIGLLLSDRKNPYGLVVIEFTHLAPYKKMVSLPVLLDMHNIESELLGNYAQSGSTVVRRLAAHHESKRMARLESRLGKDFRSVAVVSDHDRKVLEQLHHAAKVAPPHIVVASNGVKSECFEYVGERTNAVVFVAHLGWRPNIDAAVWLVHEVWPHVRARRPDLALHLVGRDPSSEVLALENHDVAVFPNVPSPLPFVGSALVATAPLLAAGGTRLKILEALAVGTPVVATPLGALGLERLEGRAMTIAEKPTEFASAVVEVANGLAEREDVRVLAHDYRWDIALRSLTAEAERVGHWGSDE